MAKPPQVVAVLGALNVEHLAELLARSQLAIQLRHSAASTVYRFTAMPVVLSVALGLGSALSISRIKKKSWSPRSVSDAELVAQLSDQAKQLGVEINLNYAFLQQQKPDDEWHG
jgi:hypothetical protein